MDHKCVVSKCTATGRYLVSDIDVLTLKRGHDGGWACDEHYGIWHQRLADGGIDALA